MAFSLSALDYLLQVENNLGLGLGGERRKLNPDGQCSGFPIGTRASRVAKLSFPLSMKLVVKYNPSPQML